MPSGKVKLIVCDKFNYSDAFVGVFDTLAEAIKARAGEEREPNNFIEYPIYGTMTTAPRPWQKLSFSADAEIDAATL